MNRFKKIIIFIMLLVAAISKTSMVAQTSILENGIDDRTQKKVSLFLLVGQSNMAGSAAIEPQDTVSNPRILSFNRKGNWVVAKNPLREDKDIPGISPGISFAQAIFEFDPTAIIGLIPAAVGGTSVNLWRTGGYDSVTGIYPYDEAIEQMKQAKKGGELKAILWHQGESDSRPERVNGYEKKLIRVFYDLRKDLHAPKVPILVGTLPKFQFARKIEDQEIKNSSARRINRAIKKACRQTENCELVKLDDLDHKGDQIHFDSKSAREMGRRYAEKYLIINKK